VICVYNLFYNVNNFCNEFEPVLNRNLIDEGEKHRIKESSLSLSEVMTVVILFHSSDFRCFKAYYTEYVMKYMCGYFPKPVILLCQLSRVCHPERGEGSLSLSFRPKGEV